MANNSNRKAIEFMVVSALPPHSTNVLWMDTSIPGTPVLKIFMDGAWAGIWTTVRTEDERSLELLTQVILEQHSLISELTDEVKTTCKSTETKVITLTETAAKDSTVAKEINATMNKNAIIAAMPVIPSDYAKAGTPTSGTAPTMVDIKTAIDQIPAPPTSGWATPTNVTEAKEAIMGGGNGTGKSVKDVFDVIPSVASIQNGLAQAGNGTNVTNTDLKNLLNGISTSMYKGVPVVTPQGSGTQANPYVLQPNQWNQFSSALSGGDIYFSKGTDIANITNCYMVRFELAANWSGTSVNFEGFSLEWNGGSVPTWTAGKTYEVNIVNNIAMWAEITPAS